MQIIVRTFRAANEYKDVSPVKNEGQRVEKWSQKDSVMTKAKHETRLPHCQSRETNRVRTETLPREAVKMKQKGRPVFGADGDDWRACKPHQRFQRSKAFDWVPGSIDA